MASPICRWIIHKQTPMRMGAPQIKLQNMKKRVGCSASVDIMLTIVPVEVFDFAFELSRRLFR